MRAIRNELDRISPIFTRPAPRNPVNPVQKICGGIRVPKICGREPSPSPTLLPSLALRVRLSLWERGRGLLAARKCTEGGRLGTRHLEAYSLPVYVARLPA